jgi:hypothetical protein
MFSRDAKRSALPDLSKILESKPLHPRTIPPPTPQTSSTDTRSQYSPPESHQSAPASANGYAHKKHVSHSSPPKKHSQFYRSPKTPSQNPTESNAAAAAAPETAHDANIRSPLKPQRQNSIAMKAAPQSLPKTPHRSHPASQTSHHSTAPLSLAQSPARHPTPQTNAQAQNPAPPLPARLSPHKTAVEFPIAPPQTNNRTTPSSPQLPYPPQQTAPSPTNATQGPAPAPATARQKSPDYPPPSSKARDSPPKTVWVPQIETGSDKFPNPRHPPRPYPQLPPAHPRPPHSSAQSPPPPAVCYAGG